MGLKDLATDLKTLELLAKNNEKTESYPQYIQKFEKISRKAIIELEDYKTSIL